MDKRLRRKQPQQAVKIDWSNPITKGLYSATIPGQPDFVTKDKPLTVTGGTLGVGPAGKCAVQTASGTIAATSFVPKRLLTASTTLILAQYPTRAGYGYYFGATGGTTEYIGSNLYETRLDWRIHGPTWSSNVDIFSTDGAVGMFGVAAKCLILVWNKDKNNGTGRVWVNARELPNNLTVGNTGVCNRSQSSGQTSFGIRQGADSKLFLTLHFDRDLSLAEIKSLSENPWQVFAPRNRALMTAIPASSSSAAVQSDIALSYTVAATVHSDNTANYSIKASLQSDLNSNFNIANSLQSSLNSSYNIIASVASPLSLSYTITGKAVADTACSYAVLSSAAVASSLTATYIVTAPVISSSSVNYGIFNSAQQSLSLSYILRTTVAASTVVSYVMREQLQRDLEVTASILNAVASNATMNYSVYGSAYADSAAVYSIRAALHRDLASAYDIVNYVGTSVEVAYATLSSVQKSVSFAYSVLSANGGTASAVDVWSHVLSNGLTAEETLIGIYNFANELSLLHGLSHAAPLVVSEGLRVAGNISQTIVDTNGQVTITRQ